MLKDQKKAFLMIKTRAKHYENDILQYELGLCYKNGIGIIINYKKAFKWFSLAA